MQKDNKLQDRFANFGAAPSDGVWAGIESQLDKKKRKPLFWWWLFGASATACFVAYGLTAQLTPSIAYPSSVVKKTETSVFIASSVMTSNNESNERIKPEKPVLTVSKPANTLEKQQSKTAINLKEKQTQPTNSRKNKQNSKRETSSALADQFIVDGQKEVDHVLKPLIKSENESALTPPSDSLLKPTPIVQKKTEDSLFTDKPEVLLIQQKRDSKWSFGVNFGVWSERNNEINWNGQTGEPFDSTLITNEIYYGPSNSGYRNYIPLHVSLQAEYSFNKRMNVRFGVAYSRFALQIGNTAFQPSSAKFFRTHTFDIPLEMNYNFIAKKKIQVYAGMGWTNSFYLPYKQYTNTFGYLGRVSGSLGTRILFTEKLALNIQPSFQYGLIDTRNNYYKKSLMFGGSVGLFFTPTFEKRQKNVSE